MSFLLEAANQASSAVSIMAADPSVAVIAADFQAPNVDWDISPEMQDNARKGAFFVALIWIVMMVGRFILPKGRGGAMAGMMGSRGMGAGLIMAAFGIIILLDLSLLPKVINWILQLIWWIGGIVGLTG